MSAVDASQLGLDLTKKPKKTKSSSTAAAADGEKKKKKPSTKKTVAVDEQELIQIEQSSLFNAETAEVRSKKQIKEQDDAIFVPLSADELEEVIELIDALSTTTNNNNNSHGADGDLLDGGGDSAEATWLDSDRDYYYPELLGRITDMLRRNNPELSGTRAKKIRMKIPQVAKDGPKKTVFINFAEICQNLNRQQEHVMTFLTAELGTNGTTDSNHRLTVKGSFRGKDIESVLRKYISEYVVCRVCGSLETSLSRDANTRLYSLSCTSCGASRTVSAVKQGYMANIVPRKRRAAP